MATTTVEGTGTAKGKAPSGDGGSTPKIPGSGGGGSTPKIPNIGSGGHMAGGASFASLQSALAAAVQKMEDTQARSENPMPQFVTDLANSIADYVKSVRITPEQFNVNSQSITTIGSQTTQTGPTAPVPLQSDQITIGSMNPNA